VAPQADAGAASTEPLAVLVLDRTPSGFIGATRARLISPQGQGCDVSFRTEVLECGDGGLTLRTEPFAEVDEGCQVLRPSTPSDLVEHRMVREP
jgi:hypothetical protein